MAITRVSSSSSHIFPISENKFRYLVKPGDTLTKIAGLYNLTIEDLLKANPSISNIDQIEIGQSINIPPQSRMNQESQESFSSPTTAQQELIQQGNIIRYKLSSSFEPHVGYKAAPSILEIRRGDAQLKRGDKGDSVAHIQRLLGFNRKNTDGVFGNNTEQAVIAFKQGNEISSQINVVDKNTLAALESAPTIDQVRKGEREFIIGQKGEPIKHLQRLLGNVAITGEFGPTTQQAVIKFQRLFKLKPPDGKEGVVGKTTLKRLERSSSGSSKRIGRIKYNGHSISDKKVRVKLQQISSLYPNNRLIVTSGDRDRIVNGNARSLHLAGRAVDFYIEGVSLSNAYNRIKNSGLIDTGYEFIYHTERTIAPHLHLGRFEDERATAFFIDNGQILPRI
jgi:peptidoglycan hydrolase-like protein with peptidoglycan-binding domain